MISKLLSMFFVFIFLLLKISIENHFNKKVKYQKELGKTDYLINQEMTQIKNIATRSSAI